MSGDEYVDFLSMKRFNFQPLQDAFLMPVPSLQAKETFTIKVFTYTQWTLKNIRLWGSTKEDKPRHRTEHSAAIGPDICL